MHLEERAPVLFHHRKKLAPTDLIVPRIAPSIQAYGLSVVTHFALMGVPALNGAAAIATSRNKMRALQLLAGAGVPVPPTVMAPPASDPPAVVDMVGVVPWR